MDYKKDITINPDALHVEWLEQPNLIFQYIKKVALTKKEMDESAENLSLVKAELDKKIRANPEKYGIEKITESVVLNTIITQEKYKEANSEYLETRYEHDVAKGVVQAVEHKKSALEQLVKLFGLNYFAGPEVPKDLSKDWEQKQRQKKVDEKVGSAMKRTR